MRPLGEVEPVSRVFFHHTIRYFGVVEEEYGADCLCEKVVDAVFRPALFVALDPDLKHQDLTYEFPVRDGSFARQEHHADRLGIESAGGVEEDVFEKSPHLFKGGLQVVRKGVLGVARLHRRDVLEDGKRLVFGHG